MNALFQYHILSFPFRCNLVVSLIYPKHGSTTGGTEIAINGNGFGNIVSDVTVSFGGSICGIASMNASRIICSTGGNSEGNVTLNVSSTFIDCVRFHAMLLVACHHISTELQSSSFVFVYSYLTGS